MTAAARQRGHQAPMAFFWKQDHVDFGAGCPRQEEIENKRGAGEPVYK